MITPRDALGIVLKHVRPFEAETRSLDEALGAFLAEDVRADRDIPPADRSAMDGFAARSADLVRLPCRLRLTGEVAAGSPARPEVTSGTCARVLTGANVPPGADTVVMLEYVEECDGEVTILGQDRALQRCASARALSKAAPRQARPLQAGLVTEGPDVSGRRVAPGANVIKRGEIARRGEVVLARGTALGASQIGVCAAVGAAAPKVHRRPRVSLVCTGRELRDAGERAAPHETRNSNGPALRAALEAWGYPPAGGHPDVRQHLVPDEADAIVVCLGQAIDASDIVIVTGGVSVGKYDLVRRAVIEIGAVVRFHGVAMKPGKPVLYATLDPPAGPSPRRSRRSGDKGRADGGDGNRHIFGLPGNPVSCMTGLHEFVLPALRRMSGADPRDCRRTLRLRVASSVRSARGRARFALARLVWETNGMSVVPVESTGSADLVAAGRADGVVPVPPDAEELPAGSLVEFRPWRPLP